MRTITIVLKVLISRIPENTINMILNACTSRDVDCKIVFVVRDPRDVIPSSKSVGFYIAMPRVTFLSAARVCTVIGGVKKPNRTWKSYESLTIR